MEVDGHLAPVDEVEDVRQVGLLHPRQVDEGVGVLAAPQDRLGEGRRRGGGEEEEERGRRGEA